MFPGTSSCVQVSSWISYGTSESSRLLRCFPNLSLEGDCLTHISLISYRLTESNMSYSILLLSERERVDSTFADSCEYMLSRMPAGTKLSGYDSSGHPCIGDSHLPLDIFELIESLPDRSLFQTMELGCCRVYSHHFLKTYCFVCVVIITGASGTDIPSDLIPAAFGVSS